MRIIKLLSFLLFNQILVGQTLDNFKVTQTVQEFSTVRDSIVKLVNPDNSFFIKNAVGYREFYFTKDSLNWTGYFIKNIEAESSREKPMQTAIVIFNADTIYSRLVQLGLNEIKQLTDQDINKILLKNGQTKTYGESSEPRTMTININGQKNLTVSYSHRYISHEEYYGVDAIKIFHDIETYLITTFNKNNYYYH